MSRIHFELIAKTLASLDGIRNSDHQYVSEVFAEALAATNPQFDRKRFLKACGVDESVLALEQVQRVENYLFATTYGSDGRGSRTWAQWYADIQDAVQLLRESERLLRHDVARRIGAELI